LNSIYNNFIIVGESILISILYIIYKLDVNLILHIILEVFIT